jgi:hypothetical protein
LRKEGKVLEAEQEQLNFTQVETKDLSKEEKQFSQLSVRSLQCHEYKQELSSWLGRNLRKFETDRQALKQGD